MYPRFCYTQRYNSAIIITCFRVVEVARAGKVCLHCANSVQQSLAPKIKRHKTYEQKPSLSLSYTLYTPTQGQQVIQPSSPDELYIEVRCAQAEGQTSLQLGD
jgi:hypothetical protein